ncbi:hypothetical protein Tco_1011252 [Tanacetum coccineum]
MTRSSTTSVSNLRRIQVKDIVKEVEDFLKTYSSVGMDISWKKRGKNTKFHDGAQDLGLQYVEMASESSATPSEVKSDGVTKKCDDVNIANKEKPIEYSAG